MPLFCTHYLHSSLASFHYSASSTLISRLLAELSLTLMCRCSPIRAAISPVHQAAAEEMRGAAQLLVEQPKVQKLLARRAVLESRDSNLPNNNNMSAANKTALYKKKPSLQEDWRPNSPGESWHSLVYGLIYLERHATCNTYTTSR